MPGKTYSILSRTVFLGLVFLASCKKDKPQQNTVAPPIDANVKNVYIACEGAFGSGNAALSLYRPEDGSSYEDVYQSANGQPIGDVLQSLTRIGDRLFLCVNNSDKVLVININNWKLEGSIPVSKPRYIVQMSETKAYISSLYTNNITIFNPQTLQVTGTVSMPGKNPEGMLFYNSRLYVALWDTDVDFLYAVDTGTNQVSIVQRLRGFAPQSVLADKEGRLWVLGGNVYKGKTATLTCINPNTGAVLKSYIFPSGADPVRPVFNEAGDALYFIEVNYSGGPEHNGVFRMGINDAALPQQALIQAGSLQYFWALGIEPGTGNIYVGDPKGFTQRGTVYIYSPEGALQKSFDCGLGPGHFYFE
jgi:DNA-binding beta-propeller fold protein YncE